MTKFLSYKEGSRKNWGKNLPEDETLDREDIQTGALLRIADAVETMTKDRVRLENDLNWYKQELRKKNEKIAMLERSRNAYKGKYSNLKNRQEVSNG